MNDTVPDNFRQRSGDSLRSLAKSGRFRQIHKPTKKSGFCAGDTAAALVSLLLGWLFCRSFLFGGAALSSAVFTLAACAGACLAETARIN